MAAHIRKQIRDAVVAKLQNLATTGTNVFKSRVYSLPEDELPALMVTTNDEQTEPGSIGWPSLINRQLNLQIKALAKATANLDDTLDAMIKEVEVALNASVAANTLDGLVKNINLSSLYIEINTEAEKPVGQAVMNFTVNYKTFANAPDIAI